jgi:cyclopropane fatty-acyl-phospholipid synthase-like methyltransferase
LNSERNYQWDAADYAQHSSEQFKWACELTEKLDLRGDETLLDIGCGDGKVTTAIAAQLPNGRVVGIDSSTQMIELAVRHQDRAGWPHLRFKLLDVRDMAYVEWFDVAFSNAALHWIKEHLQMLHRVRKALKKGGRLLFQMGGRGNAREIAGILDEFIKTTNRMKRIWSTWIWLGWKWRLSSSEYRGGSAIEAYSSSAKISCTFSKAMLICDILSIFSKLIRKMYADDL